MSVQNLVPGQVVECPRCGAPGVVAIDVFSAKGRRYSYLVVRHRQDGTVRRCLIQRLGEAQAVAKPAAAKPVAKPRAVKAAKPRTPRQARLQVEAPAPAPAPAAQVDRSIIEEAVKAAVAEILKTVNTETARIIAEAVSAAVREALAAVRTELETQRAALQRIENSVRQRKGEGARAVARGEAKVSLRPGSLHWMIVEVLRGRELTKEEIAQELEKRFGRKVSGNSLSGRLSELRGAGLVECRRQGKVWLWRLTGDIPAGSSQTETGLPSFAVGNPWLAILSGRGEVTAANTSTTTSSDLPSFAVDNPWLDVLSGRRRT